MPVGVSRHNVYIRVVYTAETKQVAPGIKSPKNKDCQTTLPVILFQFSGLTIRVVPASTSSPTILHPWKEKFSPF